MNILFLSTENPYPPDHGHHIRTYNTLKWLARENRIFFVGFTKYKDELEFRKYLKKLCATVDIFLIPQGIMKWRFIMSLFLNFFSPLPFVVERYYCRAAKYRIEQILAENQIDVVHVDMLHLAKYSEAINSVPKILVDHNVESLRVYRWAKIERNIFVKLFLLYQYVKLRRFEKKTCPQFDKCIVVSAFDKKFLESMCQSDNFVIIPNGVDIDFFKPYGLPSPSNRLVWVGAMNDSYNQDAVDYFLDQILPLVQSEIAEIKIDFVGKLPTPKLRKIAQQNSNIRICGYVEDIRDYVERADVFIAPIRAGSGTKLKVLNAMAQGKAVVTTSIGAEGIKVTDNEDIFIADTPQEFADKVVYLIKNPEVARKMGERARKVIEENYNWTDIGKEMENVYKSVIKNRKCSS